MDEVIDQRERGQRARGLPRPIEERLRNPLVTSTDSGPTEYVLALPRLLQAIKMENGQMSRPSERGGDTAMGVGEPDVVVPSTR